MKERGDKWEAKFEEAQEAVLNAALSGGDNYDRMAERQQRAIMKARQDGAQLSPMQQAWADMLDM